MKAVMLIDRVPGQTPLGLFTNLWPSARCRADRQALEGWYLTVHVGTWRLELGGAA